jgi:hypothetical protein
LFLVDTDKPGPSNSDITRPNISSAKSEILDSQMERLVINYSMTTRQKHEIIEHFDAAVDAAINLQTENEKQAQIVEVTLMKLYLQPLFSDIY